MYIIAIAWIYVVLLMALTETTLTASIMTFLFYCVLPLALFFYLVRAPQRKRTQQNREHLKSSTIATDDHVQDKSKEADVKEII